MRNFNRDRGRGGGRDFGGRRDFNKPQVMFNTICSNCGKECEVPFKPNGSKPVYCRDCYATMGGGAERKDDKGGFRRDERRDDRPSFRRSEFDRPQVLQRNEQLDKLNAKLDKILSILESTKANQPQSAVSVKKEETILAKKSPVLEKKVFPVVKKKKIIVKDTPLESV